MTSLVELEPLTDICIEILISKLNRKQGQSVDLGTWLHWYAFDVITSLTFSTRQGFMETETDVDGIINAIEGRLVYNSIIGQVPFLHKFLLGNNFIAACAQAVPLVAKLNTVRSIVKFAASQLEKRTMGKSLSSNDQNHDLLDRFRRVRDSEEVMTNGDLLNHAASNVWVLPSEHLFSVTYICTDLLEVILPLFHCAQCSIICARTSGAMKSCVRRSTIWIRKVVFLVQLHLVKHLACHTSRRV